MDGQVQEGTLNVLTFDLEEWYVYQLYAKGGSAYYLPILDRLLNELLDFLEERQFRATFFCLGAVARSHPQVIRSIAGRGHEVGCHSDLHRRVTQLSRSAFEEDTHRAIDRLAQVVGSAIDFYRAPAFSITAATPWAFEVLIQEGIRCDCSLFPGNRRGGGWPSLEQGQPFRWSTSGGPLWELPMSFGRMGGQKVFFSGGGYFRLLPYALIHSLMSRSVYNMTYFHLRDFDGRQKRVLSRHYIQSYFGVGQAFEKFKRLGLDFSFVSVGEALSLLEEGALPYGKKREDVPAFF